MGQRRAPLLASPSGHVVDAAAGCFGLGKRRIVVHPELTQFTLPRSSIRGGRRRPFRVRSEVGERSSFLYRLESPEQIALKEVVAVLAQEAPLLLGLYPFGDDLQSE